MYIQAGCNPARANSFQRRSERKKQSLVVDDVVAVLVCIVRQPARRVHLATGASTRSTLPPHAIFRPQKHELIGVLRVLESGDPVTYGTVFSCSEISTHVFRQLRTYFQSEYNISLKIEAQFHAETHNARQLHLTTDFQRRLSFMRMRSSSRITKW